MFRFLRKHAGKAFTDFGHEPGTELLDGRFEADTVCGRPLDRRALEQGGDRVQIIGICRTPQAHGLQRKCFRRRLSDRE